MPTLTKVERQAKLQRLAELLGFKTIDEMFNPWCQYIATVAPDERAGCCPTTAPTPCRALWCSRGQSRHHGRPPLTEAADLLAFR
jgi:hypothetical protein